MPLPRKVGSFTLIRLLNADALEETYLAILDNPPGKAVLARRLLPSIARNPELAARIGDLRAVRRPGLSAVLGDVEVDHESYLLEEATPGIDLGALIRACATHATAIPPEVFLHFATQLCSSLEALHSLPGAASEAGCVLHMALNPGAIGVRADGKITVGRYGLVALPVVPAAESSGPLTLSIDYLAPEQTHQDTKLSPASDLFSLGAVLYELATRRPLFRADTSLQTLHRIRRSEVTTQLLEVKELMPGLDKVLFRALSLNPRHRYQRAFVLREDLRGLMADYSFAAIEQRTRDFLLPLAQGEIQRGRSGSKPWLELFPEAADGKRDMLVGGFGADDDPTDSTASLFADAHPMRMSPRPTANERLFAEAATFVAADADTDVAPDAPHLPPSRTTGSPPGFAGRPTAEVEYSSTALDVPFFPIGARAQTPPAPARHSAPVGAARAYPALGPTSRALPPYTTLLAAMLAVIVLLVCAGAGGVMAVWLNQGSGSTSTSPLMSERPATGGK